MGTLPEFGTPVGPPNEVDQDLMVSDLLTRGSCNWNTSKVKVLFPLIKKEILSILPSKFGASDAFVWTANKAGIYTTNPGYYVATKRKVELEYGTVPIPDLEWTRKFWSSPCLPKIKLFMWKLLQGDLPLGANLERRGCANLVLCKRCGEQEKACHLILECNFAKEVWALTPFHQGFDPARFLSLEEAVIAGLKEHCLPLTGLSSPLFMWVCWSLWTARNRLIFENKSASVLEVSTTAIRSAREWSLAQPSAITNRPALVPASSTTTTRNDVISVYTDAAWRQSDGVTGCRWLFRNSDQTVTQHGSRCFDYTPSVLIAEALAVRLALSHALSSGYTRACIYSDCQLLIKAISSKSSPVELYGIARDIDILSSMFEFHAFYFISHSLNSDADSMAKAAICNGVSSFG